MSETLDIHVNENLFLNEDDEQNVRSLNATKTNESDGVKNPTTSNDEKLSENKDNEKDVEEKDKQINNISIDNKNSETEILNLKEDKSKINEKKIENKSDINSNIEHKSKYDRDLHKFKDKNEIKNSNASPATLLSTISTLTTSNETNLKFLFKNTRYFLIKSINYENVNLSKSKNVWSTLRINEAKLNKAFKDNTNVLLIFSVAESGKFQGYARLATQSRYDGQNINWLLPSNFNSKLLSGVFRLDWITKKEIQFTKTQHLLNPWNDNKPVKIGRDGQEIEPNVGESLCRLFPLDPDIDLNQIISKAKRNQNTNRHRNYETAPFNYRNRSSNNQSSQPYQSYSSNHNLNSPEETHESSSQNYTNHQHSYENETKSDLYDDRYTSSKSKRRSVYEDSQRLSNSTNILETESPSSSRHQRRSASPRKRRRSPSPDLMNIPKDVVLNGTYQDYQSYIAASSNRYSIPIPPGLQAPPLHNYYPHATHIPTTVPYPMNPLYDHLGLPFGTQMLPMQTHLQFPITNSPQVDIYGQQTIVVPQMSDQVQTQKYLSKYEQDVEEFLRRTSQTHTYNQSDLQQHHHHHHYREHSRERSREHRTSSSSKSRRRSRKYHSSSRENRRNRSRSITSSSTGSSSGSSGAQHVNKRR